MDDQLIDDSFFAAEDEPQADSTLPPYKLLIIDDEVEIHSVTRLALNDFEFEGHRLEFLSAYNAQEAKVIFADHPDIAVALVDVVMESEHAGLDLTCWIRQELGNHNVRLVLRTGQPGQAPESKVIREYDINDYKAKTELTSQKLYTLMYTALRAYQHIILLEQNKQGMEQVILATRNIIGKVGLMRFVSATLEQLLLLTKIQDSVVVYCQSKAAGMQSCSPQVAKVVATTGQYRHIEDQVAIQDLPFAELLNQDLEQHSLFGDDHALILCRNRFYSVAFYLANFSPLSELDKHLLTLFAENIAIALENTSLNEQLRNSQKEVIYKLSEIVESRSKETGNHVKRVAKYSELLGQLWGLDQDDCEVLLLAAPLHDIGKVSIPDQILNKPGKLDEQEWGVMQSHASIGEQILTGSDQLLLQAGACIAGSHHERWDGKGYPSGLLGNDIPLFARIVTLADIFDALASHRVYKPAWPLEQVLDYIKEQSGQIFDPHLVELMMDNLDDFLAIRDQHQDG